MQIPAGFYQVKKDIESHKYSLRDIMNEYLSRIESNKDLNAFTCVFEDVTSRADEVNEKILNGSSGKLAGLICSVKDVISIKGKPLTCSSGILSDFKALYSATAVERLENEDAIIIGKVNCDEFAMGSSNENSFHGPVLNPIDKTRVPGGSSGGSAVSVAADLCMISLGSETGGSIRQPASYCGITGLKVSYGRISRFGLTAFASSFDSIGVFGKEISDIASVLEVIAGYDENDSTSSEIPVDRYCSILEEDINTETFTIGIVDEYFSEGLNPEIKAGLNSLIEKLRAAGVKIKSVSLPYSKYVIQTYYILTSAEASSNLARYDGVRYGLREVNSTNLEEMYVNTRSEGFGTEVKRRIMLGTYVLSSGYYDAYYRKAQKIRRLIKSDFDRVFHEVDYILSPTTPTTAFKLKEKIDDPLSMYLNDIYTASINLAGIPAISIPAGYDSNGLPYGVQVIGKKFDESGLFKMHKLISNTINSN